MSFKDPRAAVLLPGREHQDVFKVRDPDAGGRTRKRRKVKYAPRGAAQKLLTARDAEICIAGPAGTGKSLAALWKIHLACAGVPGVQALMVRQTHLSLASTTLKLFEKAVIRTALDSGIVRWFGGNAHEPPAYIYQNGSQIIVGGLDKPDKFLSAELDLIFVDEANQITKTAFEILITRLRGTAGMYRQIILACNPDHPKHWIKLRCESGSMRMMVSLHRDNPIYYQADGVTFTEAGRDYIQGKLGKLTGVRRLRLLKGMWAAAEGVIYEEWNEATNVFPGHLPTPKELGKKAETKYENWRFWWAIDFGYNNPFVWQMWAEDPDGRLILAREIYRTGRIVSDHAKQIQEIMKSEGWPEPDAIVCDHDAEDRATLTRELGRGTIAANKKVIGGITLMQARVHEERILVCEEALVDVDQALLDANKPTCTLEEFPAYVWANKGRRSEDGELKDEPLKENDHGMDAARYIIAHRDWRGNGSVRFM